MARPEWAVVTRNDIDTFMRCDGKIIQEVQSVVDGVLARTPASAVEEVELTHSEWLRLWTTVGRADEGKLAQAGKSYLASLGLRIVRDAKPVPADQSPHHAGVVPTTVPTSITFTETTAGVYNYSGGPFKNEGGGYLPEHFKVPAKIEAANVVIRQDGGEPEPLPDCLIQRFNQLSIRISALEATVDSLDSGQTEPKTVAAAADVYGGGGAGGDEVRG